MNISVLEDVRTAWYKFLKNLEIIRHYNTPYLVVPTGPMPNPLLDQVLPSTLAINLVSLLDESLGEFISFQNITGRAKALYDKIEVLAEAGFLENRSELHALRRKRNELAHTDAYIEWKDLDDYVGLVDATLRHLDLTGERPEYDYFFERIPVEPKGESIALSFLHRYGLKRQGREVLVIEFQVVSLNSRDESGPDCPHTVAV